MHISRARIHSTIVPPPKGPTSARGPKDGSVNFNPTGSTSGAHTHFVGWGKHGKHGKHGTSKCLEYSTGMQ
jgi:hypothetical protein